MTENEIRYHCAALADENRVMVEALKVISLSDGHDALVAREALEYLNLNSK